MEVSDETLVQQVVRLKDLQAFERLVQRHEKRILHLQRRFVRDHALAEADQIVLLLSYGHGLSIAEIADVLNAPDGTIKSQIHRAKDKIRRHFSIGAAA